MTDEQNGGLDKEQRREFARLATDEATLLGQGQQEFWGIEPLVELLQHGAEGVRWRGGGVGFGVGMLEFGFGTSVIPKIRNRSRYKEPAYASEIFNLSS